MPRTLNKKVVLLGTAGVGKTAIVIQFTTGKYTDNTESTIGASFSNSVVPITEDEIVCKFQLWDTAGQERFHSLAPMYYRGADVAIVVYDLTSKTSFDRAKHWVSELDTKQTVVVLVGNKADMPNNRQVPAEEARSYAELNNLLFFETSAKTAANVKHLFSSIAKHLVEKENQRTYIPTHTSATVQIKPKENTDSACCS